MKPPQSKQSKEYNSNERVDPVIRNAVSSGNWHGATHSKLSEALHLFRTHTPRLDYMRISQDGIQFKGWLEKVCEIPWDDTAWNEMTETAMSISVYARYDMMLRYQAKCSDDGDRKKINEILCYLRDAVTLMAIHMSRGYKDHDAWRTALSIMQHDLTVKKISLWRSWRARTTTCSTTCRTHGCQGVREEETDQLGPAVHLVQLDLRVLRVEPRALQWTKATSQASRPRGRRPRERAQASHMHTMLALLQTNMRGEFAEVWRANERLHDNFVRVETDLRELRACFVQENRNHAAAQEDIRCLRDALRSAVAEISRLKSENSVLRVRLQNNQAE